MLNKVRQRATHPSGLVCYICGYPVPEATKWHLDHVRPLIGHGRHHEQNLEIVHAQCNLLKADDDTYPSPVGDDVLPLLTLLRGMDPDVLWRTKRDLARKVFLVPRPVPIDPSIGRLTHAHAIVVALRRQKSGWPWGTRSLDELAAEIGLSSRGQLDNSFYDKLMGWSQKGRAHGGPGAEDHDLRLPPHPLLVPARFARGEGRWGTKALRLRGSVPLDLVDAWIANPSLPLPAPRIDLTWPDADVAVGSHDQWSELPTSEIETRRWLELGTVEDV